MTHDDLIAHYRQRPCDELSDVAQMHGESPRAVQDMFDEPKAEGRMEIVRGFPRVVEGKE